MDKKNPLFAGLLNMLVPGSGYWYVNQDRGRFVKTLIVGVLAITAILVLGSIIPNTKGFPVTQGVCVGILLLIVLVPLFMNGMNAANRHNSAQYNANVYNARQQGDETAQLADNQNLRDKGYISKQEYDSRRDNIKKE